MRISLFVLALLAFRAAGAQTLNDPVYLQYSHQPRVTGPGSRLSLRGGFLEAGAAVPPLRLGRRIQLVHTLYYRNTMIDQNAAHPAAPIPSSLHDVRYTTIIRTKLSERWELTTIPRLMLRSDLKQRLSGKDLFPQVVVLGNYAVRGNPNFRIGLGIAEQRFRIQRAGSDRFALLRFQENPDRSDIPQCTNPL